MDKPSTLCVSFRQFVESQRKTDGPEGDFIADACRDDNLPNARSWQELQDYFDTYPTWISDEVYVAAKLVWGQYRSSHPTK